MNLVHYLRLRKFALFGLLTAILAVASPLILAVFARYREPHEWLLKDWVALFSSILLGVLFFALAWIVDQSGQQRARAVADAALITSVGALAMSSARSFAGDDQNALRVAADARAALQHYPFASRNEQRLLVARIEDSYSDLTFGTFTRADSLPRSVREELWRGTDALIEELERMTAKVPLQTVRGDAELTRVVDHVRFCSLVGASILKENRGLVAKGLPHVFDRVWGTALDAAQTSPLAQTSRIRRLSCLYRRELAVVHDWSILLQHEDQVSCSVTLNDISDSADWYAPWYVETVDGRLRPVNVEGKELNEVAKWDTLQYRSNVPEYPNPIRHGDLPLGMRTGAIDNLCNILSRQRDPVTVCILGYDLKIDRGNLRLILDGNHRLAALRKIAKRGRKARVVTFLISEQAAIDEEVRRSPYRDWKWYGFTPDIGLLRGHKPSGPASSEST